MPGTGTNDSSRNRISAPIVNHSLFLSSVAFWKFASVMLEARCSAADAIRVNSSRLSGSYKPQFGHCEERSDEAIHCASGLPRYARNDGYAAGLAPALREP